MPYRFLDDIATADVAFEIIGACLTEVFAAAAEAFLAVTVADTESVRNQCRQHVDLTAETPEMLLFDFLQELVFLKDRDQLLLRTDQLTVASHGDGCRLHGDLRGERLDYARHDLVVDIKAVTMHQFHLAPTPTGWLARVVLDI